MATDANSMRNRASELSYAAILLSVGDGLIATDEDSRITFMNPAAESLTGWLVHDALQKPVQKIFKLISEKDRSSIENPSLV